MDLDAYVAEHQATWRRLEQLTRQRRLSGAEADELVDLYQQVATHLSLIRTGSGDPGVIGYLSGILSKSRSRSAGTTTASWRGVTVFFAATFPAALYRLRRWWIITMLVSYVLMFLMGWWLVQNPQVESSLLSPQEVDQLVNNDFASYYEQDAAGSFAARVWTNNAWVAALCIALGVLGLPVVYVLLTNLVNVAIIGSIMVRNDRADVFFGLITPHGLLELTAVFVAAAIGLRLFWSWVEPGPRTRTASLASEGRAAAGVVLGLAVVLLISGIIEGFVTPSPLPTWARIGIGVVAEVAFFAYVYGPGRAAYRRGVTGDLLADRRAAEVAVAA